MNPESHKTAETITWTLKDSEGNRVAFKLAEFSTVMIQYGDNEWRQVDKEHARRIWKEYMDRGFRVQNKCVNHDMKKFHNARRNEEVKKSISASMDKYIEKHKKIMAKKSYTDNWDNYALEA